jgi:glycosyltransferase involved in cell wall biosynthesis
VREGTPAVSVIIPAYNAAAYIEQCLNSILVQTLSDIEVIVVDDGSSDATPRILADYARIDTRLTTLAQEHGFAGRARNLGMQQARGEYLAFLDADDFFEPQMLERMLLAARTDDLDVALCRADSYDVNNNTSAPLDYAIKHLEPGVVYSADDLTDWLFRYSIGWPWDKLFRREFIAATGLRYPPLKTSEDAYFVFMALALAQRLALVDAVLVHHRVGNVASNENSRFASWQDALTAEELIEDALKTRGLWKKLEPAYLAWILDFNIWNFETLTGPAQEQFYVAMREKLLAYGSGFPPKDRLFYPYQAAYLRIILDNPTPTKALRASRLPRVLVPLFSTLSKQ